MPIHLPSRRSAPSAVARTMSQSFATSLFLFWITVIVPAPVWAEEKEKESRKKGLMINAGFRWGYTSFSTIAYPGLTPRRKRLFAALATQALTSDSVPFCNMETQTIVLTKSTVALLRLDYTFPTIITCSLPFAMERENDDVRLNGQKNVKMRSWIMRGWRFSPPSLAVIVIDLQKDSDSMNHSLGHIRNVRCCQIKQDIPRHLVVEVSPKVE